MGIVLAVDAGTTGVRTFAVGEDGTPVASAYREFTQHFPAPALVEHDAEEIWNAVAATMAEVVATIDQPVACIGITDQRETIVAWDRSTGTPRHRAIVWQDRRTADRCEELAREGHLELVRATTGLVLDPYFSASKMEWLLSEGGVEADAALALGTIDSWLLWKLSGGGVHATEPSNASRTMLFDIDRGSWSEELCDLFGVPLSALGDIGPTSGRLGVTAGGLPVPEGIPISGMAGDQQASLFGQACFDAGMTKNTYGTGSFVLMNVGTQRPEPIDGLLTTVAWQLGADGPLHYALEGAIFATGATVQWLRDGLEILADASETEALARQCESSEGVVVVPAFAGLGSPWWDPYARGTVLGITRGTGRPQVARAVVESMALQTRDVVDAMQAAVDHHITALRVDGGASAMDLLLQLQADQLGVAVARSQVQDTTALGAAYLAGLAEGVWGSLAELGDQWQADRRLEPNSDRAAADALHERWLRGVARSRDWARADAP